MKRIAIFASGNGSNAQKIIEYFREIPDIKVAMVLSNRKDAMVLQRAARFNIPAITFSRDEFYNTQCISESLKEAQTDMIVLAGFLWLLPASLIREYPNRIINIHPALLPKYGGKGMYGMLVHESVIRNHEKESGITIHYVNEKYDEGEIIFQAKCNVESTDTPDSLATKIHELEHQHFPEVIHHLLKDGEVFIKQ